MFRQTAPKALWARRVLVAVAAGVATAVAALPTASASRTAAPADRVPRSAAAPADSVPRSAASPADSVPLWTDPDSPAARQVAQWRREGRDADAALLDRIALRPQAEWLHGPRPGPVVRARTTAAARAGRAAVLVAYYVPNRDCGQYSSGGAADATQYRAWVDEFAAAIGDRDAWVIVEPDAVAQVVAGCTQVVASERYALLAYAVGQFGRRAHTRVYLDAGNPGWIPEAWRLVDALRASGVAKADGVALNTSNFQTDEASSAYGDWLSKDLGGTHYVVDTSRNGNGPATGADSWCNPPGRALGTPPATSTGHALLDAYLWIKRPGESDGTCRGGPAAGQWWAAYALGLARNAHTGS